MDEPKQIGSFENLLWAHPDIAESVEPSLLMLRQLAHQMAKNQTDGQTLSPNGFDVPILFRLTMGRMILETDREAFEAALSFFSGLVDSDCLEFSMGSGYRFTADARAMEQGLAALEPPPDHPIPTQAEESPSQAVKATCPICNCSMFRLHESDGQRRCPRCQSEWMPSSVDCPACGRLSYAGGLEYRLDLAGAGASGMWQVHACTVCTNMFYRTPRVATDDG